MARIAGVTIIVIAFAWMATPVAQVGKVYPIDDAGSDPGLVAFKSQLLVAIKSRDAAFVYSILADDILNSFADPGGSDEFKAKWKPEDPNSDLWNTLTEILALGGQFQTPSPRWSGYGSKMFVAPYLAAAKLPGTDSDPYAFGVVIGSDVRVRQRPSRTSAAIATLSFDVIRVRDWRPVPDVEIGSGRS